MRILIEQLKQGSNKSARSYWTFWVRLFAPGTQMWVSISGWRYYPDKRTVSSPSVTKGEGHYHNLVKLDGVVYNIIVNEVERALGIEAAA